MLDEDQKNLPMELRALEERLALVEERNRRVEGDKAWEVSRVRICVIAVVTYLLASMVFFAIEANAPFRNAIIPTLGYLLSTLSLPAFKRMWVRKFLP